MVRRMAGVAALTALVLTTSLAASAAPAKPGGACPKPGAVAKVGTKSFVCSSAKRWAVKKPVPKTPPAAPAPTPPATPIPAADYATVALRARTSVQSALPPGKARITLSTVSEDSVPGDARTYIDENASAAVARLSPYLTGMDSIHIVAFVTQSWGLATTTAYEPNNPTLAASMQRTMPNWGQPAAPGCTDLGGFAVGFLSNPMLALDAACSWTTARQLAAGRDPMSSVVAHEFTHLAQSRTSGKPDIRCVAPVWFVEGQPQVVGAALAVAGGVSRAIETRNVWVARAVTPGADTLAGLEVDGPSKQEYGLGALAVEYLIARSGFTASMDLIREAGRRTSDTCPPQGSAVMSAFGGAFRAVYGQSIADFYTEVLPYLAWGVANGNELTAQQQLQPGDKRTRIALNQGCHGAGTADLQQFDGTTWVDVAPAMGWDRVSACADPTPARPWTLAAVPSGTTVRWHVYAPGRWDWYSTPYTLP